MKRTFGRVLAASASALALLGMGLSAASAAETTNPNYAGTFTVADAETALAMSGTIGFEKMVVALPDINDYMVTLPIPAGATEAWTFVSPRGSESTVSQWNAKASIGLTSGGILMAPVGLGSQIVAAGGTPNGINAVKGAGGDYSLGVAYTINGGVTLVPNSLHFVHIHVTAGSGDWTWEPATKALTATTTTLTAPASATEGNDVTVSATVAPSAATGTVQFKDGGVNIGSPVAVSGGSASTTISAIAAGSHSITAVYSGDASYATSTSSAATIAVAGAPKSTTLAVTAVSASGQASQNVVYTATVSPAAATGSVAFSAQLAGGSPVALGTAPVAGGVATLTVGGLPAGAWTVTAAFTGTGVYQASTATASLALTAPANAATPDPQTVEVVVPDGTLTITTPWTAANPLKLGNLQLNQANSTFQLAGPVNFASATDQAKGIQVISARAANPHFTAQVASTDFTSPSGSFAAGTASLVNIAAHQVQDNALLATNVTPTQITALSNTAQTFATYGGAQLGTAWLSADMNIAGVPSSTPAGTYTATVTFTAF